MNNSLEIAKKFGKEHDKVCRIIGNIIKRNPEFVNDFILSHYISSRGRRYQYYLLTDNAK